MSASKISTMVFGIEQFTRGWHYFDANFVSYLLSESSSVLLRFERESVNGIPLVDNVIFCRNVFLRRYSQIQF